MGENRWESDSVQRHSCTKTFDRSKGWPKRLHGWVISKESNFQPHVSDICRPARFQIISLAKSNIPEPRNVTLSLNVGRKPVLRISLLICQTSASPLRRRDPPSVTLLLFLLQSTREKSPHHQHAYLRGHRSVHRFNIVSMALKLLKHLQALIAASASNSSASSPNPTATPSSPASAPPPPISPISNPLHPPPLTSSPATPARKTPFALSSPKQPKSSMAPKSTS